MYRTIDSAFWTDPVIRRVKPNAKLLALYLVTNPHSHVGGIYYLPQAVIELETGLPAKSLDTLSDTLSGAGFARFDQKTSVVWVRRMFFYQGRGEKNERAVARHLESLHKSCLINDFLNEYPGVLRWISDRVSIGHPAQDEIRPPVPVLVPLLDSSKKEEELQEVASCSARGKKRFVPPTVEEVAAYCRERKNGIDAEAFVAHYQANGWRRGKGAVPVTDWKACVVTWEKTRKSEARGRADPRGNIAAVEEYCRGIDEGRY